LTNPASRPIEGTVTERAGFSIFKGANNVKRRNKAVIKELIK
jgi:hypothetical protein